MVTSFRDLNVWQRSVEMSVALNRLIWSLPQEERSLTSRLRRASVFVTGNIAEGWIHMSDGDYVQYFGKARGTVMEVQSQLHIAEERGLGDTQTLHHAEDLSREVSDMLATMLDVRDGAAGRDATADQAA